MAGDSWWNSCKRNARGCLICGIAQPCIASCILGLLCKDMNKSGWWCFTSDVQNLLAYCLSKTVVLLRLRTPLEWHDRMERTCKEPLLSASFGYRMVVEMSSVTAELLLVGTVPLPLCFYHSAYRCCECACHRFISPWNGQLIWKCS